MRQFVQTTARLAETGIAELRADCSGGPKPMNNGYLRGIYLRLAGVRDAGGDAGLGWPMPCCRTAPSSARWRRRWPSKVASVGASIRALVLKAEENGVPFGELYGVEQRFDEVKEMPGDLLHRHHRHARAASCTSAQQPPAGAEAYFRKPAGAVAAEDTPSAVPPAVRVGDHYMVSMPIASADRRWACCTWASTSSFVDDIVLDMLYDVLVVLVVALFFTLELLHFIAGAKLEAALKMLGDTFERGASGDFRTRGKTATAGLRLADPGAGRHARADQHRLRGTGARRRGGPPRPGARTPPGLAQAQAWHNICEKSVGLFLYFLMLVMVIYGYKY